MTLIYIAGKYTGDQAENVRKAVMAGDRLLEKGYIPYIPHLSHLWHLISPHDYETWIKIGLAILERCDAIFMVSGWEESIGAKKELDFAQSIGLEVIYGI